LLFLLLFIRMADPDEMLFDEPWVLYKDRDEWTDITPVPQDDGPNPIVKIAYSEKFQDVYDYFRAILRLEEKSERALRLTQDAIALNPANYTVWQYRRSILKALDSDLKQELKYLNQVIKENPKNYQVWHHRQVIVEWLRDPSKELSMTAQILQMDAKNYHAWQHRQWVVKEFGLWDGELEYIKQLLLEDIRNNSVWNHRYFIINNTSRFTEQVLHGEVEFTISCIRKAIHNESPWNYLKGILFYTEVFSEFPGVQAFCDELYQVGSRSPYLLAFMVDLCEDRLEHSAGAKDATIDTALQLCASLEQEHDTIRAEYWKFMASSLALKFRSQQGQTNDVEPV